MRAIFKKSVLSIVLVSSFITAASAWAVCDGRNNGQVIGFFTSGSAAGCGGISTTYASVCSGVNTTVNIAISSRREVMCAGPTEPA